MLQSCYHHSVQSKRVPGTDYAFAELPALACLNCQARNSDRIVINLLSVSVWEPEGNPRSICSWRPVLVTELTLLNVLGMHLCIMPYRDMPRFALEL